MVAPKQDDGNEAKPTEMSGLQELRLQVEQMQTKLSAAESVRGFC
jgi:hypothetical protein